MKRWSTSHVFREFQINTMTYLLTGITQKQTPDDIKCWQGPGLTGSLTQHGKECSNTDILEAV